MSSGSVSNEAESCTLVPGAESGKWSRLALLDGQVTSIVLMDADAELLRAARTAQLLRFTAKYQCDMSLPEKSGNGLPESILESSVTTSGL